MQGGGHPPELARFDLAAGTLTTRIPLDVPGTLTDLVVTPGETGTTLWVGSGDGIVVRIDAATGTELDRIRLPGDGLRDLQRAAATDDPAGLAVWARRGSGAVDRLASDGTLLASFDLGAELCCLTGDPGSETTWIVATSGDLFAGHPGVEPTPAARPGSVTDVEGAVYDATSVAPAGLSVWIARGPWLTEVRFPQ